MRTIARWRWKAERPSAGIAYERFTATGPLAILPLADGRYTVVWTLSPDRAAAILALDDASFIAELQRSFGWRIGRLQHVGKRAGYPLQLSRAESLVGQRAVLVGNAAQALHPVAGQGFNLGLRDAALLAEMIGVARPARRSWKISERRRADDAANDRLHRRTDKTFASAAGISPARSVATV